MDIGARAYINFLETAGCASGRGNNRSIHCCGRFTQGIVGRIYIPILSFVNIIAAVVQDGSSALDSIAASLISCSPRHLCVTVEFIIRAVDKIFVFALAGIVGIFSPSKALDIIEYRAKGIDYTIELKKDFNCLTARLMLPVRVALRTIALLAEALVSIISLPFSKCQFQKLNGILAPIVAIPITIFGCCSDSLRRTVFINTSKSNSEKNYKRL